MNADQLLAHYERVADAPETIPRLRRFILDLAVRGKLVPQDPNDELASELLKRIAAEKARLVKAGEIRKPKRMSVIEQGEPSFDPPRGWVWSRLLEISRKIHYGFTASANRTIDDVRLLRITDIQDNKVEWRSVPGCEIDEKTLPQFRLEKGDVLIARTGGTIGKSFLVEDLPVIAVFASYLIRVQRSHEIYDRYLKLFLESPVYWAQLEDGARGAGQPNVNGQTLGNILVPLPPLAEQHRIVAKVDELMALCDQLKAARDKHEVTRGRLAAASFARLNRPDPDEQTFRKHAAQTLETLAPLTTRPDQIKPLRQTILNLAALGYLVPQAPSDEPASELLKRAREAKKRLMSERGIRRDSQPEISASGGEDLSPAHWSWAHVYDLALVQGGKRLPPGATFANEPTGHIYIRVTDMKNGTIATSNLKHISESVRRKIAKYTIDSDDLYITIAGTIGEVGKVPLELDGQNLTENAAKIVFREIERDFLLLALNSDDVQDQFREKTKQMAQPKLALKRISGARIPIPPLAEQRRIVARVDGLMVLCDRLEASLDQSAATRRRLLDALLAEALAPSEDVMPTEARVTAHG